MQFQKFAGLVLGSVAFLSMTAPSFAVPLSTDVNRLNDPLDGVRSSTVSPSNQLGFPKATGRISYYSSSTNNIDCRSISVTLVEYTNGSSNYQTLGSTQAQGSYQRNGFCSYAISFSGRPAISSASSIYRTFASDGSWSGQAETFGGDLLLSPTVK